MDIFDPSPLTPPPTLEETEAWQRLEAAQQEAKQYLGGYQEYRPTRTERFWRWLGFRPAHAVAPPEWDLDAREWAVGYCVLNLMVYLDWKDRLRVLLTGRLQSNSLLRTDVPVARLQAITVTTAVPPPWAVK